MNATTPKSPLPERADWPQTGLRTALVAGVFSLVMLVLLVVNHFQGKTADPVDNQDLVQLKAALAKAPGDEQLKKQVRALDLDLRRRHFRHVTLGDYGAWMLLAGTVVFLISYKPATHRKRLPKPPKRSAGEYAREIAQTRWAIAGLAVVVSGLAWLWSLKATTGLNAGAGELASDTKARPPSAPAPLRFPTAEELRQNWPRFRGADGGGVAGGSNAPVRWDVKTGAGIAWKAAAPAPGFNSPIVWGDRLFLSGGDARQREVLCFDAKSGQMLWRQPVVAAAPPGGAGQATEVPETTGYAAATMATDGERVYAFFANGDLAALKFDGGMVWSKSFAPLKNTYGHAASLALWHERLILQLDQGESEEGKSKLYALDGRTGQIVWQQPRKVGSSWATPIVIEAAGKAQVITLAVPWVIAYAATDGTELWRVDCLNGEITPSPVFAGGLVLVASPSEKLLAIRPDGQGDVTKTHVAWTTEENVPDVTSPVSNGDLVFTVTTAGLLTSYDAKDGKKLWEHDFDTECHASPSLAGNRLYVFSQKGTAVVVEAERKYKELFRTDMGDEFHASPAFVQDRMFLRGVSNVWCVGAVAGDGRTARP